MTSSLHQRRQRRLHRHRLQHAAAGQRDEGVGEDRQAANAADHAAGIDRRQLGPLHIGRPAAADKAVEGLALVLYQARFDQGLGNVRPADGAVARQILHTLEGDGIAQGDQLADHGLGAADAALAQPAELGLKAALRVIRIVAQHVQLALGHVAAQLDGRNDLDAGDAAGCQRLVQPFGGVVVADGDGAQAQLGGHLHQIGGAVPAVRGGGVAMEVDGVHGGVDWKSGGGVTGRLGDWSSAR